MGDVHRNEKARQKHRQLLKEVCGCKSVPSSVVESKVSSVSLAREKLGEGNNFGWAVYDRRQAGEDCELLRHKESFGPHKEYVVPKTTNSSGYPRSPKLGHTTSRNSSGYPRSPKPGHTTSSNFSGSPRSPKLGHTTSSNSSGYPRSPKPGHTTSSNSSGYPRSPKPGHTRSSFTDSTQVIERDQSANQPPGSPRNEEARLRRRQLMKEELCCSSISSKDSSVQSQRQKFNEDNHFGWTVVSKANGDPEFERLMQFHEKPDITGNEFKKKTYVLYMPDGTVIDRDSLEKAPLPIGDLVTEKQERARESEDKEKKKNLLSELFYLPFKERARSRSPKTGKSKQKLLGQLTDLKHAPLLELEEGENEVHVDNKNAGDISDKSSQEKVGTKSETGTKKKRGGSLRRYLRAGGDGGKRSMTKQDSSPVLPKISGIINYDTTIVVNSKRTDESTKKRVTSSEYLLDTPSGTNEYLYLSKRNVKHRMKPN